MRYADVRNHIKSGDMLLWTHRRLRSWYDFKVMLVRIFTMSKYSHVATAFVSGGRVWVIESVTPLPRLVPLSNCLPCDWAPMKAPWRPETEEFALSIIGKEGEEYSEGEAVRSTLDGFDPFVPGRWFCSKLVWRLLNKDGIDAGKDVTPSGLADFAMERSSVTTLT